MAVEIREGKNISYSGIKEDLKIYISEISSILQVI